MAGKVNINIWIVYWIFTRKIAHDGITYKRLVNLTIGFFSTEPSMQEKLENKRKGIEGVNYMLRLTRIENKNSFKDEIRETKKNDKAKQKQIKQCGRWKT